MDEKKDDYQEVEEWFGGKATAVLEFTVGRTATRQRKVRVRASKEEIFKEAREYNVSPVELLKTWAESEASYENFEDGTELDDVSYEVMETPRAG